MDDIAIQFYKIDNFDKTKPTFFIQKYQNPTILEVFIKNRIQMLLQPEKYRMNLISSIRIASLGCIFVKHNYLLHFSDI